MIEPLTAGVHSRAKIGNILARSGNSLAELPITIDLTRLTGHVVIAGYVRVGGRIGAALAERGVPVVIAERSREVLERLRQRGVLAVAGDASEPAALIRADLARARLLVIAVPHTFRAIKMIEIARVLKPDVETVVRAHSDEAAELFRKE